MNFEPNTIIGSYRVLSALGEGGMGAVYEVEHVNLGVHYALKTYTMDGQHAELFRKRFSAEGKLLARMHHPNLVRVFDLDFDEASGTLYYVMDLVLYKDGEAHTLEDLEPGGADEDHIYDWFCQLASALSYVHEQGIVHRDIKLNNILLAPNRQVILSDFGISRIFGEQLRTDLGTTRTMVSSVTGGLIIGTQGYMAPEVMRGQTATPAADIYSLGVVFFKLLTGIWYDADLEPRAYDGETVGPTDAVRLLFSFERPWKDVLPAMLASDPARRPTDLMALTKQLANPNPASAAPRKIHPRKRTWAIVASLTAAATVLVAIIGKTIFNAPDSQADDQLIQSAFAIPGSVQ